MLKLQSLEISGFKSFPDGVGLTFAGGITAVVGPNGCGKSNVSDAMTWVLGEQSAKTLRGGRMEDIIFNGSEQRKPLGLAEATLTLATDPAFPHAQEGRITLGRRVFRSGESQYRINGKLVRLKEIKDLLMDTGLGIRAYSVIEQGRIGMILSGKPQERRKLLEEAAGITRYKQRKRVAEVKLEEATANLHRLDDILSEVERALRSLKRQATAARRYKQKEEELRLLLRQVLDGRWLLLRGRLEGLGAALETLLARDAELAAELARGEAALAEGREQQEELSAGVAAQHQEQAELAALIEGRQEYLKGSRRTLEEIGERGAQGRALAQRREQEVVAHRQALEELAGRRREIDGELAQASEEVSQDQENVARAQREMEQAEARVEALRGALLEDLAKVNHLRSRHHQKQMELEKGSYRRKHLLDEAEEHGAELRQGIEKVELAQATVADLEARGEEQQAALAKVSQALEACLRREAEAGEARRSAEDELSLQRQRQRLLTELGRAHAERRSRLEAALAAAGLDRPVFLEDRLEAVEGWERSLDFYLQQLSDAVLLEAGGGSLELARRLWESGSGARLVEPLAAPSEGPTEGHAEAQPTLDDPAVVLSLAEALGLDEGLAGALPPAYLVKEAEDARRLARRHSGVAFLSREGLWAAGGTLHVEAREAAPGVLERERELADLEEELPRLEERVSQAVTALERLVEQRAGLAREKNSQEGRLAQLNQELAVARARYEDAVQRRQRLEDDHQILQQELVDLDEELAVAAQQELEHKEELAAAEAAHERMQEAFDRAQAEVEAARTSREGARTESASRQGRLQLLQERLASHQREVCRLEEAIAESQRQSQAWSEESDRLERRRLELNEGIEEAEGRLQEALERRSGTDGTLRQAQEQLDAHRRQLKTREGEIATLREVRDEVRGQLENRRIEQAELKQDTAHLKATFAEHFPGEELTAEGLRAVPDLEAQEAELARTRATLERLGPVNLLAVEELEEKEERHAFLTVQRRDVAESVIRLRETIREINDTSSERFQKTFAEVNESFGKIFARLFRGGEAEMRLLDEEDILETGIEIVARPPGKRPQNLMLLSGGEKALTAIALLFALFQTKPSPFCILDEVDAPLDDVNTVRFVELLKEMAEETQFIVITHNKITMEAASTLYGVTMEEKGVSKLVSVEIDDVQPGEERQAKSA